MNRQNISGTSPYEAIIAFHAPSASATLSMFPVPGLLARMTSRPPSKRVMS